MSRHVFYIMLTLSIASLPFVARAHQSPAGQEGKAAPQSISKLPGRVEFPNISFGASNPSTIKKNNKRRK
jgi:hypothetical protein